MTGEAMAASASCLKQARLSEQRKSVLHAGEAGLKESEGESMTEQEIKNYINLAIKQTIHEYKKNGLLKQSDDVVYGDASEILANYYNEGAQEASITYAIQGRRFDPYFRIIPMYYGEGKTGS